MVSINNPGININLYSLVVVFKSFLNLARLNISPLGHAKAADSLCFDEMLLGVSEIMFSFSLV